MRKAASIQIAMLCLLMVWVSLAVATEVEDRSLFVDDRSFEDGLCGAGSSWTCWTDTSCPNWIIDPMPLWGVPAHDGTYVAQLGGSCDDELNSNSFCQELYIDWGCGMWLSWSWMGIVAGDNPGTFSVTVSGAEVVEYEPMGTVVDTEGTWEAGWVFIGTGVGFYTFCFEFEAGSDESAMLIDSVSHLISPTPIHPLSFSAVKSLY
jgi:hypothetical protein